MENDQQEKKSYSIRLIIADILVTILGIALSGIFLSLLKNLEVSITTNNAFRNIIMDIFIFGVQICFLCKYNKKKFSEAAGLKLSNIRGKYAGFALLVPTIIVVLSYFLLSLGKVIAFHGLGFQYYDSWTIIQFAGILFVQMIFVAIAEEFFFRSVIEGYLYRAFGEAPAVLLSTVIFTVFHCMVIQSVTQVTDIFVLGLLLGIIYSRTKSIIYTMIFHFGIDFFTNIVGINGSKALVMIASDYREEQLSSMLFGIMTLLGGVVLIVYFMLKRWKQLHRERIQK